MIRRPTPTLTALTLALLIGLPAYALADDDATRSAEIINTFGLISAEQAKAIALKEAPGLVTELELDDRDYAKGWKWEVEVVDADGREVEVDLDAKTGKVLKIDKEWF